MKNIEVKMEIRNFRAIENILKDVGAVSAGKMRQKDTYYHNSNGRLKIREIDHQICEIIFYKRPNKKGSKISDYSIETVPNNQCKNIKRIYRKNYGEKVVVDKERKLWFIDNTRIHLDRVKDLGTFLELETVVKDKMTEAKKEFNLVFDTLKLTTNNKIKGSYCDILLNKLKTLG